MILNPAHLDNQNRESPIDGDPNAHIFRVERLFPDPIVAIFRQIGDRLEQAVGLTTVPCRLEKGTTNPDDSPREFPYFSLGIGSLLQRLRDSGYVHSTNALKKLDILDLGCGSDAPEAAATKSVYPPNLCRNLHSIGVHAVGVDVISPDGKGGVEDWEFHNLDLSQKGSLDVIPSNSFDIVNCDMVIGHTNSGNTSPRLGGTHLELDSKRYKDIEAEIFTQALRVLRDGGLLTLNHGIVYRKVVDKTNFCFKFELVTGEGKNDLPYTYFDCSALQFQECSPQAISLT
ncbi:MAG: hypothetical protein UT33_C0013G0020 [Candidatus Peregrinibacteria bacterium GW2011_GWC2_39_14]|nr:MAG: hypothetical protein US92_C0007G0072 [Candidatus Peregrinibacteria bacterium GW2011_GWA2_38_36]KKR05168.1 MAG: hypothetical protein UT33_C0013G0020 [Candidatus Peregrinibacteria bacterium GW2011_GWC2_39_14]